MIDLAGYELNDTSNGTDFILRVLRGATEEIISGSIGWGWDKCFKKDEMIEVLLDLVKGM